MASPSSRRLLALTTLATLALPALSQEFKWSFTDAALAEGGDIRTCTPLRIRTDPATTDPLYMISYEIGGTPQIHALQTVDGAPSYTVRHGVGSRVIFNLADRLEMSGGVLPGVYNVVAGDSTDCVVSPPRALDFAIHANHTGSELETCQPWALAIEGGTPPYSVSIASPGAPSVTNVTMDSAEQNLYTYINRVPPGAQVLAAVADSQGRWARGVPLLTTKGGEDTACGGAQSAAGVATPEQLAEDVEEPAPVSSSPSGSSSTSGQTGTGGPRPQPTGEPEDAGSATVSFKSGTLVVVASVFAGISMML